MTKFQWDRARPKPTAAPEPEPVAGAWTHISREPVYVFSQDEKAAFLASRPDLLNPRPSRSRK